SWVSQTILSGNRRLTPTSQVYTGRLTESVVSKFTEITKQSLKEFINDKITDRLKIAVDLPDKTEDKADPSLIDENDIIITEEEREGFLIVKAILREVVDISRIQSKCTKSYFGINFDGKVAKTVCRLWFKSGKKSIGMIDVEGKEVKKAISSLDEIYGLAEILKDRAKYLTQNSSKQPKIVEPHES
ncbi:MAG: restriction endonuclease, partial [Rhizonema sp. NSF051]|nr:restriction endonuclease [Rhizonema sp. NSF051]